jgi:tetratricopeptide (TPR) repeat protein
VTGDAGQRPGGEEEHPMAGDRRLEHAREVYERAVFEGDRSAVEAAEDDLDGVEADLALARGRLLHARFLEERQEDPRELTLFERAAELYRDRGDGRGEGEALLWVGIVHQVVRDDSTSALPILEGAYGLADRSGDALTASYAARHVGFALAEAGRSQGAREKLEESVRLRREIGFAPGVAAGLLSLAEFARRDGRSADARKLLGEADAVAEACGAHGVRRWIEEERVALGGRSEPSTESDPS